MPPGNGDGAGFDNHDSLRAGMVWRHDSRGRAPPMRARFLASEGIPARTIREQDHLLYATVSAPFEVFVPSAFAAKAKEILKAAHASEESLEQLAASGALEIPAEDEDGDRATESTIGPSIDKVTRNLGIKYATPNGIADEHDSAASIAWSGDDFDVARMIEASLRENAIHFRTISDRRRPSNSPVLRRIHIRRFVEDATSIFVLPEDEVRCARDCPCAEITRRHPARVRPAVTSPKANRAFEVAVALLRDRQSPDWRRFSNFSPDCSYSPASCHQ